MEITATSKEWSMITLTKQKLTFEQFLEQCPDDGRYELIDGEIVEISSTRKHKDVSELVMDLFKDEVKRLKLQYKVTNQAVIKTNAKNGTEHGRIPDVNVIDLDTWRSNRSDYAALQEPIQLAVEVTSTNWDNDYIDKLYEYEAIGIKEYWIVDYLAIASRDFLGNPKLPTISIYSLNERGKYTLQQFRGSQAIVSKTFPELIVTAEEIFQA
jgi:Uma2 family endonuclease